MRDWFKNLDGRKVYGKARWHITGNLVDFGRAPIDASRSTYVKFGERVFDYSGKKVLKKEPGYIMFADAHRVYTFGIND